MNFKRIIAFIFFGFFHITHLIATSYTWEGGATTSENKWTNRLNWTPSSSHPNTTSDEANFSGNPVTPQIILDVSLDLNKLLISGNTDFLISATGVGGITFGGASPVITMSSSSEAEALLSIPIFGVVSITKSGNSTFILTPIVASYTGSVTLEAGILSINSETSLGNVNNSLSLNGGTLLSTASFSLRASRSITLGSTTSINVQYGTALTISGVISGAGGLNMIGSGALELNGTNTYTGTTTVSAGTLKGTGRVAGALSNSGGTVAPGNSIGTFTVGGNYTQNSSSTLAIEINKDGGRDVLAVVGSASLSGTVVIDPLPGQYTAGTSYTFLTAGSIAGTFNTVSILDGASGSVSYTGTTATFTLANHHPVLPVPAYLLRGNAKRIANYLFRTGHYPTNSDLESVYHTLLSQSSEEFPVALRRLGPTQFGAFPIISLESDVRVAQATVDNWRNCSLSYEDVNADSKYTSRARMIAASRIRKSRAREVRKIEKRKARRNRKKNYYQEKPFEAEFRPYKENKIDPSLEETSPEITFKERGGPFQEEHLEAADLKRFRSSHVLNEEISPFAARQSHEFENYQSIYYLGDQKAPKENSNTLIPSKRFMKFAEDTLWVQPIVYDYIQRTYTQHQVTEQINFNAITYGVVAGCSGYIHQFGYIGGQVGYTHSNLKWAEDAGNANWDTLYFGPSLGWLFGTNDQAYVDVILQGAVNFYYVYREIVFPGLKRIAHNYHQSYDILLRTDAGIRLDLGPFFIQPDLTLNFFTTFENSYVENGANSLNLRVNNNYSYYLRPEITVRVGNEISTSWGGLFPSLILGCVSNIPLSNGVYSARLNNYTFTTTNYFSVLSFHRVTYQMVWGGELALRRKNFFFGFGYQVNSLDTSFIQEGKLRAEWSF